MANCDSIPSVRRSLSWSIISAAMLLLLAATTAQAAMQESSSDDWFSTIFSTSGISIMLIVLLVGLIAYKRYKTKKELAELQELQQPRGPRVDPSVSATDSAPSEQSSLKERRSAATEMSQVAEKSAEIELSAYGAYRIDQEVTKLAMGKPHRMDVMSSRAPEDRRAIEASLIKAFESHDSTEDARRRICQALEEYGFLARQSATMLMGRDAWERSSAARMLGQIGAPTSLPFLVEALHDSDSVVRNQAVSSLGSLKLPSAIGALLDIARRHPDIPTSLLSEVLSACSVESLGYLDAPTDEPDLFPSGNMQHEPADGQRFASFDYLPALIEDEQLDQLVADLQSPEDQTRTTAAQQLAAYPNQQSVEALTQVVLNDANGPVRAAAVASLGAIDHESVFAPVLIALADESRVVRAAAARTLTSLHFGRAEGYVRVAETANEEILKKVAQACIQTRIVAQAVDRLASEDRRQAYEAFSLFSLLARAHETDPIIDAIENHKDNEVRLCAVRVLNLSADSFLAPKLRDLVAKEGMPEDVRTAVLEVLYKLDRDESPMEFTASDIQPVTLHNSP